MATTSGSSRHDGATIITQTATFGEASSVTMTLLPAHSGKSPHAEAVDQEERRRCGADRKERSAECSVSIPAARGPPPAAASAATAGVPRRDEVDPVSCYPQRDSAWAAALAACIALLIVHELVSPLFALHWPFLFSLAFFLLCGVSAFAFIAIWILLAVVTSALVTVSARFALVCTAAADLSTTGSGNSSVDDGGTLSAPHGADADAASGAADGTGAADGVDAASTESDGAGKQHGWWQRIVQVAKQDSEVMCASVGTASAISCAGTATLILAAFASMSAYSSLGAGTAAALASGLVAWIAALALCFLYCLVLPNAAAAKLSFLPSLHIALRALSRAFPTFLLLLAVSLVLLLPVSVLTILVVGYGGSALAFVAVCVLAPLVQIWGPWNLIALFVVAVIFCFVTGVFSSIVLSLVLIIGVSTVLSWDLSSQAQTLSSGRSEFHACLIP
ncbi:unnamed protein product [Closterium sp. Yama58-4]|nr:unnamed protein product [Closterium sp. Yama58-4]